MVTNLHAPDRLSVVHQFGSAEDELDEFIFLGKDLGFSGMHAYTLVTLQGKGCCPLDRFLNTREPYQIHKIISNSIFILFYIFQTANQASPDAGFRTV